MRWPNGLDVGRDCRDVTAVVSIRSGQFIMHLLLAKESDRKRKNGRTEGWGVAVGSIHKMEPMETPGPFPSDVPVNENITREHISLLFLVPLLPPRSAPPPAVLLLAQMKGGGGELSDCSFIPGLLLYPLSI